MCDAISSYDTQEKSALSPRFESYKKDIFLHWKGNVRLTLDRNWTSNRFSRPCQTVGTHFTVEPRCNEPCNSEDPVTTNNIWKLGRITVKHMETNPAITNWLWRSQTHNLPRYNEYFVLSLSVSKNDTMIWMADKPNTTRIGQDRETMTFKALLYLNVAVYAQVCRLFWVVYIP